MRRRLDEVVELDGLALLHRLAELLLLLREAEAREAARLGAAADALLLLALLAHRRVLLPDLDAKNK